MPNSFNVTRQIRQVLLEELVHL